MFPDEADRYFETHSAPPNLKQISNDVRTFIEHHLSNERRVVLISSGGTIVPLENQTVRFIDNFSAGTRGATSAEYFLEQGYAVVFLHRQFSLLPYSRHYSHSTNCFLDFLSEWGRIGEDDETVGGKDDGGDVVVRKKYRAQMLDVLRKYRRANEQKLLLLLPFTTVTSYLFLLREVAIQMQSLGNKGLFYLAAAVSDFFVPPDRMVEHKIQSGDPPEKITTPVGISHEIGKSQGDTGRKLIIDLDPVPKFLKRLVDRWAPDSMIISFKVKTTNFLFAFAVNITQLETDSNVLLSKCYQALERYQHHLVVGNLLSTRKFEVVLVDPNNERWIRVPEAPDSDEQVEIESLIVPELVKLHQSLISNTSRAK